MSMFLTHEEVCALTGARTKAGQIETLKRNGIRHSIKRNGWPSVTTAAIMHDQKAPAERAAWKPAKAS